jgi:hypothetical protein
MINGQILEANIAYTRVHITEMSTKNIPGVKGLPARKADNLTAIYEPTV